MRTLIDLPDHQIEQLAEICEREKVSRAAVIRRAVEVYLASRRKAHSVDAFGLWGASAIDGLAYQERLRSEW